jgi:hypothetical protein
MATQKIVTREFVLCFFAQFALSSVFFILIPTIPIYLSRLGSAGAGIGILVGVLSVSSSLALSDFGSGMGSVIMGMVLQLSNYQTNDVPMLDSHGPRQSQLLSLCL